MKIKKNLPSDEERQKHRNDIISALEAVESREKVRSKVAIPYEVAVKLRQFLKEKGILESQGIPLLIQYGLGSESEEELKILQNEMMETARNLWGGYAVMKFRAYKYFMENKVMVMNLSKMLDENKMLKRRLELEGLQKLIPIDEWDSWDKSIVNAYYQKYVLEAVSNFS